MKRIRFYFPARYALICALIYGVIAALWIYSSTKLASFLASSIAELEKIESYKGYAFVALTTGLFFLFSRSVFRRMDRNAQALVQSQRRLVQAERDAITGLIATSVAHDFTNLLTILRLNTERLKTLPEMPTASLEPVARLDRGVDRLTELANRMRQAGQQVLKDRPRKFDLAETLSETLDLLRGHSLLTNCTVQIESPETLSAIGYPILIHQLMMNLILNAGEATEGRGKILIRASRVGNAVSLEVHDNGPGVPTELHERVFEAFYTTKSFGSGLGLMSVKSCVDIHGGSISIRDSELGGAAFCVLLPDLDESRVARLKLPESLNKTRIILGDA